MKAMSLFDTKNRLSEVCDQVLSTGEPVVITRRGRAIVQIVPIQENESRQSVWSTVAESRAKYGKIKDDFDLPERNSDVNRRYPLS